MNNDEIVTAIVLELAEQFPHGRGTNVYSDRRVILFALKKYTTPWVPSEYLIQDCMRALLAPDFEYR